MTAITCPQCGKRLTVPAGFSRAFARCPACKATVTIEEPGRATDHEPPAIPPAEQEIAAADAVELVRVANWAASLREPPPRRSMFSAALIFGLGVGLGWYLWGGNSAEQSIGESGSPVQLAAYFTIQGVPCIAAPADGKDFWLVSAADTKDRILVRACDDRMEAIRKVIINPGEYDVPWGRFVFPRLAKNSPDFVFDLSRVRSAPPIRLGK